MRRPLCVFCAGTLGLELVCAFLPQTGRFVPFAAFFIAGLLWALAGRLRKSPAWGYGICLILGAVLGLVLTGSTQAKWDAIQTAYDGRSVLLEAEVESTAPSYFPGRVRDIGFLLLGSMIHYGFSCVRTVSSAEAYLRKDFCMLQARIELK